MSTGGNSSSTCPESDNSQRCEHHVKWWFANFCFVLVFPKRHSRVFLLISGQINRLFLKKNTCLICFSKLNCGSSGSNSFLWGGDHKCHWLPPSQRHYLQRSEGSTSPKKQWKLFNRNTSKFSCSWRTCCWTRTVTSRLLTLGFARRTSSGARPPR